MFSGMKEPLNWYHNHELNFNHEKEFGFVGKFWKDSASGKTKFEFEIPTLFIAGKKDTDLPPAMSKRMERWLYYSFFLIGNIFESIQQERGIVQHFVERRCSFTR